MSSTPSNVSNPADPRPRVALALVTVLALVFLVGTVVTPWSMARGDSLGLWLHVAYSPTCHQMPERSLQIAGNPLPVCARCEGLYVGGTLGLLAGLAVLGGGRRIPRTWLVLALLPSLIDFALPWVGLTGVSNVPRFILALPAGFVTAVFLATGVADLFVRKPVPAPAEVIDA